LTASLVEVVHELITQSERDEIDLIGRRGELADEHVAAGINSPLGFGAQRRRNRSGRSNDRLTKLLERD
jgi:hypothetical protein